MQGPRIITLKTPAGNRYQMQILSCSHCNAEIRRKPTFRTKGPTLCRSCANSKYRKREVTDYKEKLCKKCGQLLPLSKFPKSKTMINHQSTCSKCIGLRRFGVTAADYKEMLERQNRRCAICGKEERETDKRTESGKRDLALDHCHRTMKVRALLCTSCNTGLGTFKDNPELLIAAAEYLKLHSQNNK